MTRNVKLCAMISPVAQRLLLKGDPRYDVIIKSQPLRLLPAAISGQWQVTRVPSVSLVVGGVVMGGAERFVVN